MGRTRTRRSRRRRLTSRLPGRLPFTSTLRLYLSPLALLKQIGSWLWELVSRPSASATSNSLSRSRRDQDLLRRCCSPGRGSGGARSSPGTAWPCAPQPPRPARGKAAAKRGCCGGGCSRWKHRTTPGTAPRATGPFAVRGPPDIAAERRGGRHSPPQEGEQHTATRFDNAPRAPQNSPRGRGQHQHVQSLWGTNPRAAWHLAPVRGGPPGTHVATPESRPEPSLSVYISRVSGFGHLLFGLLL